MTDPRPDQTVGPGSVRRPPPEPGGERSLSAAPPPEPTRGHSRRPRRGAAGEQPGPDADPEAVAREIVLRQLTVQARSRSELARTLKRRAVPEEAASSVLDRMEEVGLVNDAAFADAWVRSRQSRRHLSRRALRQELVRKGVERDDIDGALEQVDGDDEYASAKALAAKKLRSMSGLDKEVRYRRLAGALARRGFSAGITSRVLAEVLNGPMEDHLPPAD